MHARSAPTVSFLLALGLTSSLGCQTPPTSAPEPAQPQEVFVEEDVPVEPTFPDIQAGICPAALGEAHVPYFGDFVGVLLPAGATEDNFLEMAPTFARGGPIEFVDCQGDTARIGFMALTMYEDDTSKSLQELRAETLEAFGYVGLDAVLEGRVTGPRHAMWVYEVPADERMPEPAKILFTLRAEQGTMVAFVLEVSPTAWPGVVDTLVASSESLTFPAPPPPEPSPDSTAPTP